MSAEEPEAAPVQPEPEPEPEPALVEEDKGDETGEEPVKKPTRKKSKSMKKAKSKRSSTSAEDGGGGEKKSKKKSMKEDGDGAAEEEKKSTKEDGDGAAEEEKKSSKEDGDGAAEEEKKFIKEDGDGAAEADGEEKKSKKKSIKEDGDGAAEADDRKDKKVKKSEKKSEGGEEKAARHKSKKLKKEKSTRKSSAKGPKREKSKSLLSDVKPRYQRIAQNAALTKKIKENNPEGGDTLLDKAMSSIDVDPILHDGITVWKVTTTGSWESRIITVAHNNQVMLVTHKKLKLTPKDNMMRVAAKLPIPLWTPSKGLSFANAPSSYLRYIDVADLDGWNIAVVGTKTLELARIKSMSKVKKDLDNSVGDIISIYHSGHESLNLVIENVAHRKALINALHKLYSTYRSINSWIGNDALLLRYIWYDIDGDKNELISKKEFSQICARINFYVKDSPQRFDDFVAKHLGAGHKELTYKECTNLLESMKPEQPGTMIWNEIFGEEVELVGVEELLKFLKKQQREKDLELKDAQTLMLSINTIQQEDGIEAAKDETTLTQKQFTSFLNSTFNDAFDPDLQQIPRPLTEPLSHYWINTSHNTYLTGDQLQSKSSVEAYIRAMLRGCKCLELDCWDGPFLQEVFYIPVVFHGHTLTSKIEFRHIILAVNNFLEGSPNSYPIILSLENHCSHPYQRAMAVCMADIFGDKLFVPTPEQLAGDQPLPSPEVLKGKVVIKGKRPPEDDEDDEEEPSSGDGGNKTDDEGNPFHDSYEEDLADIDTGSPAKTYKKPPKVDPALANLTLFHGTKFKSFDQSIEQNYSHMHSIGETKINKLVNKEKDNANMWRKYNMDHMTRTYPAGARVDSSNYNPTLAWAMGCQLVALNFQTHDVPLLLNDGRFKQNGGCGYVLKPKGVMNANDGQSTKTIKIQVLGGNCLPKPNAAKRGETIDPYVIVELHDVEMDDDGGKEEYCQTAHTTEYIDDNGFCPVWNDEGKEFIVHNPEVAIFLFKMFDKDVLADDKVAAAAIPVSCLRQGYRSIQLYDHQNSRTGAFRYATLLVKID
jgi:phosphatidylinositol phospholipase C delta